MVLSSAKALGCSLKVSTTGTGIESGMTSLLDLTTYSSKMAKQISEDTQITLDLKTIGLAITGLGALISMWFVLQADIAEAKELPEAPEPVITRMEFDMKDQLVRQTIMTTQDDVTEIKEDIKRIEEKIDKLK